jgi:hypothetical protein
MGYSGLIGGKRRTNSGDGRDEGRRGGIDEMTSKMRIWPRIWLGHDIDGLEYMKMAEWMDVNAML